jgi:chromosome partitioning protein
MLIIASYNIKGGVGKTATAVNLAYISAQFGARTLVWDLDPQGAASFYFRIKSKVIGGAKQLLAKKTLLEDFIKGTDYDNLDLLPADFSYRNLDLLLEDSGKPQRRLLKQLKPLTDDYDVVFLDCAPSISLVSESVFRASDALLIPTIPTTLSLRTLSQVRKYCHKHGLDELLLLPFFSMVDSRKQLHRHIVEQPPADAPSMLKTSIPYASEVERMSQERRPVCDFAHQSRAARAYYALWEELLTRLIP